MQAGSRTILGIVTGNTNRKHTRKIRDRFIERITRGRVVRDINNQIRGISTTRILATSGCRRIRRTIKCRPTGILIQDKCRRWKCKTLDFRRCNGTRSIRCRKSMQHNSKVSQQL